MEYCLDANTFISAKNAHYQFDVCPGFWKWLEQENGRIGSIANIGEELMRKDDGLREWVSDIIDPTFFTTAYDREVQENYQIISQYVADNYEPAHASSFLSGADPWLIAFALTHGCVVVTHETLVGPGAKKVKIPNICNKFGVRWVDPFAMLKSMGACFVLASR